MKISTIIESIQRAKRGFSTGLAELVFPTIALIGSAAIVTPAWSQSSPAEELFVIGTDSQVYAHKLDAKGNPLGDYFLVQSGQVRALATVDTASSAASAAGTAEIFVIGTDSQVYFKQFNSGGDAASNYSLVPGQVSAILPVASLIGSGSSSSLVIQLFVIGTDGQVYVHQFDHNGNPVGGYAPIPGVVKAIAAGHAQSGSSPLLFVIGTDSKVYMHKFDINLNPTGAYIPVPCMAGAAPCPVEAITSQTGNPVAVATGADGQVWVQRFDGNANPRGSFEAVQDAPTILNQVKGVSVSSVNPFSAGSWPTYNPTDRSLLFVIGTDNQVYEHLFDAGGNPLGQYVTIPGVITAIYAHHELFAIGPDHQVMLHKIDQFGAPLGSYITIPNQVKAIGGEVFLPPFPIT